MTSKVLGTVLLKHLRKKYSNTNILDLSNSEKADSIPKSKNSFQKLYENMS